MMYDFSKVFIRSVGDEEKKKDVLPENGNPEFKSVFIPKGEECTDNKMDTLSR